MKRNRVWDRVFVFSRAIDEQISLCEELFFTDREAFQKEIHYLCLLQKEYRKISEQFLYSYSDEDQIKMIQNSLF